MADIHATVVLLQMLTNGPSCGLDLMKQIETKTRGKLRLSMGSTYTKLRAMEESGLLESSTEDGAFSTRGGRPKRTFKLTAAGRRQAKENLAVIRALYG
jgi:DNA-binding PadR family transcriptional regulator